MHNNPALPCMKVTRILPLKKSKRGFKVHCFVRKHLHDSLIPPDLTQHIDHLEHDMKPIAETSTAYLLKRKRRVRWRARNRSRVPGDHMPVRGGWRRVKVLIVHDGFNSVHDRVDQGFQVNVKEMALLLVFVQVGLQLLEMPVQQVLKRFVCLLASIFRNATNLSSN